MFKMKKNLLAMVLILVLALTVFTGCMQDSKEASTDEKTEVETKLDEIKNAGKIVLGTAADYPPYEFHKQIDGKDEIVGFDIDIAKAIADELGVELEIKDMKFEGLLAALQAGNIDFIVAGMTPSEKRKESVDFSIPYYVEEQSFLVKAGEGSKYKNIEDLKGLKIGAQKATIQEDIATNDIEDAEVKGLGKITDLVLELKNDKVEGIVMVKPVAKAYAKANDDLEVAEICLGKEDGVAIAVPKDSPKLLEAIDGCLEGLMSEDKIGQFIKDATILAEE